MNRLNKIILSCVLPFFFLLISVSYADLIDAPTSTMLTITKTGVSPSYNYSYGGYTYGQISTISKNYGINPNNETCLETFNTMVSAIENAGYNIICWKGSDNYYYYTVFPKGVEVGISNYIMKTLLYDISNKTYSYEDFFCMCSYPEYTYATSNNDFSNYDTLAFKFNSTSLQLDTFYSKVSIKNLSFDSGSYVWDGTYFYESSESEEPDTPSLPSNAEIAQAVQAFYDSDLYKNNKDFEDFIVMYNTTNGNYSIIGHTLGNILGQVIIPPNYRFQGKLYNEQWWKFYIDENQGATPYASTYHLYNINNTAPDVISDYGVGKINELVNLDFSSKSVIVYSTTDYPVRTYVLDETTGDYTYTDGIIEGDQYTYDENLDPTISGYNPLDNFVTVDPSQTIIGDADFEGFTDVFEDNKELFSFTENMQWLIVANNKLSNYFLGFVVMCALFITLGRVLKG